MQFEQVRSDYWKELERKERIDQALSWPLAAIVAIAGLAAFMWKQHPPESRWLVVASIICLGVAAYYIIRSFYRIKYGAVAYPEEQLKYFEALRRHFRDDAKSRVVFEAEMRARYACVAQHNVRINDRRVEALYWAKIWIAAAALALTVPTVIYLVTSADVATLTELKDGATPNDSRRHQPDPGTEEAGDRDEGTTGRREADTSAESADAWWWRGSGAEVTGLMTSLSGPRLIDETQSCPVQ